MKQEVEIFNSPIFGEITAIEKDGEPWFIGREVAGALGYSDTAQAVKLHCKYMEILKKVQGTLLEIPPRGLQIVNEYDIYRLVMRSKLPDAEKFQDWVVEEVLPSIRKTGAYSLQPALPDFSNPVASARAWADQFEAKQLAEASAVQFKIERDEAVKRQAYINNTKTATALANSGVKTKKITKLEGEKSEQAEHIVNLENQLGKGENFKQVKAIDWLSEHFDTKVKIMYSMVGRYLSRLSKELKNKCGTAPSSEYGSVKTYQIEVINHFKQQVSDQPELLAKYRKHEVA